MTFKLIALARGLFKIRISFEARAAEAIILGALLHMLAQAFVGIRLALRITFELFDLGRACPEHRFSRKGR